MDKKSLLVWSLCLLLIMACTSLSRAIKPVVSTPSNPSITEPVQDSPTTAPQESTESGEDDSCHAEKWKLYITSVDPIDMGDGTKIVIVRFAVENNSDKWGAVKVSYSQSAENVILTTADGQTYKNISGFVPSSQEHSKDQNAAGMLPTGFVDTVSVPPGFVITGQTLLGDPKDYNFAFRIPNSETPKSITVQDMEIDCTIPPIVHDDGKIFYAGSAEHLKGQAYALDQGPGEAPSGPSADQFPDLVGSRLETPNEVLEFTGVARAGDTISITLNFTNLRQDENYPTFGGYVIGENQMAYCQPDRPCDEQGSSVAVLPGQTVQDIVWSFKVPENESGLMFVYDAGDYYGVSHVYRLNPK